MAGVWNTRLVLHLCVSVMALLACNRQTFAIITIACSAVYVHGNVLIECGSPEFAHDLSLDVFWGREFVVYRMAI